jgi:leucyl aminopeptidase
MTTLYLSDGIIKDEVLVVGLSHKKSMRDGKASLEIESGEIALDTK